MTDPPLEPPPDGRAIVPPESVPPISAEALVDGVHSHRSGGHMEERRYPSTIGGAFYLLVLGITAAGLVVVLDDWRSGVRMLGGALVFAAAVRAVLSPRDAGMLAVRHKALDVTLLAGLGVAVIFLATSIPDQPSL